MRHERGPDFQASTRGVNLGQLVGCCQIPAIDGSLHTGEVAVDPDVVHVEHVGQSESLEGAILLHAVLDDAMLAKSQRILDLGIFETLFPNTGVADGYGCGLPQGRGRIPDEGNPRLHHRNILELAYLGWCWHVLSITGHLLVLGEEVKPRNPYVGETAVTNVVVFRIELRAHLSDLDAWHAVSSIVSQLHKETVKTVVVPVYHQLRHDGCVRARVDARGPPLHRGEGRRVNDKLVRLAVERGSGLKCTHVGPMAQLCLGVRSEKTT
mmetsp:Transcript_19664/g.52468  ORF Transcript_19664/g.52468 Transcript_19664/m.52468 type:complete len:267 (-) Transcript_19664:456-1256(-)